jgi:hypothetical protein
MVLPCTGLTACACPYSCAFVSFAGIALASSSSSAACIAVANAGLPATGGWLGPLDVVPTAAELAIGLADLAVPDRGADFFMR